MNIKELILKEFINLFEKRSHPELNIKETTYEQLKKYLDSGKEYYISFTQIDKIGINPLSRYNTPIGIYTYPLQEIYKNYKNTDKDWDENKDVFVPFPPKEEWEYIYIVEKKPDGKYVDIGEYSSKEYDEDREKLVGLWGEQVIRNAEKSMYEKARHKTPGGYFWYITYFLVYQYAENRNVKWNELIRKTLGYDGITDKSGIGIIHPAEPIQAVFFSKNSFDVVDRIKYVEFTDLFKVFINAIKNDNAVVVKKMIDNGIVDPSADDNYAIRYASYTGYLGVVKVLLRDSRVDPSANDNYAIQYASEYGYTEVVKVLLQDSRVDPSADDNYAIQYASANGHLEIVKLLLQDKRVKNSLSNKRTN